MLNRIETAFLKYIKPSRADGTVTCPMSAQNLARHLLRMLMDVHVLARARLERALLESAVAPAFALLNGAGNRSTARQ
jgi:TetR/AcrR family transcriptional regulator, transcriptional repressor for nem operon